MRTGTTGPTAGFVRAIAPQNFGAVGPQSTASLLVAVPGARIGDFVNASLADNPPGTPVALPAGVVLSAPIVAATGQVGLTVANLTAAPINVDGIPFELQVLQPENCRQT
jgi:hypothetical protein